MLHIVTRAKQAPLPSMEPGKLLLRKEEYTSARDELMDTWPDYSLVLVCRGRRNRGLAFQATLEVEPADKR